MIAWSTTPAMRRWSRSARMAPAAAASSSSSSSSATSGANAWAASVGVLGEQLLGELGDGRGVGGLLGRLALRRRAADPVVLDDEACGAARAGRRSSSMALARGARRSSAPTPRTGRAAARTCRRSTGRSCAATGPERSTTSWTVKSLSVGAASSARGRRRGSAAPASRPGPGPGRATGRRPARASSCRRRSASAGSCGHRGEPYRSDLRRTVFSATSTLAQTAGSTTTSMLAAPLSGTRGWRHTSTGNDTFTSE